VSHPLDRYTVAVLEPGTFPEPTYPAPLGSVDEARTKLDQAFEAIEEGIPGRWGGVLAGDHPLFCIRAPAGLGKTHKAIDLASKIALMPEHTVYHVIPHHKLSGELLAEYEKRGVKCFRYLGRDQPDPDANDKKIQMCRDLPRLELITFSIHEPDGFACKNKAGEECPYYKVCGYQKQKKKTGQVIIIPQNLIFKARDSFLPKPYLIILDESFRNASFDDPIVLDLQLLIQHRDATQRPRKNVPRETTEIKAVADTADLNEFFRKLYHLIIEEPNGRVALDVFKRAELTAKLLRELFAIEVARIRGIDGVKPNLSYEETKAICDLVTIPNQETNRLKRFWELSAISVAKGGERSLYLEYNSQMSLPPNYDRTGPGIRMKFRNDIHETWISQSVVVLDGSLDKDILTAYFGSPIPIPEYKLNDINMIAAGIYGNPIVYNIDAPISSHSHVRQIKDKSMAKYDTAIYESANARRKTTQRNNIIKFRSYIEVRVAQFIGKCLVVCQLETEGDLRKDWTTLPKNVGLIHFNATAGVNSWEDAALIIIIGRTQPTVFQVEEQARLIGGREIFHVERFEHIQRVIRASDGRHVAIATAPSHPDPLAEAIRWQIEEAELMQAIGRARAINRTAGNPVQIDILTNVVLPLAVDELTTWGEIQAGDIEVMAARGAILLSGDAATVYPDQFPKGAEAARKALDREREKLGQMRKYEKPRPVLPEGHAFDALGEAKKLGSSCTGARERVDQPRGSFITTRSESATRRHG